MNKQFLIFLLVIAVVAGGVLLFTQQKKSEGLNPSALTKVSVALDWFPWSGQAGLWVAKEKGYFAKEELDVDLHTPSDPSTVLQTVASGQDNFGISLPTDLLFAREQGLSLVSILALEQHPLISIVALKESGITEPKGLVGKKVGVAVIPTDERLVDTILKSQGKSVKDAELIDVGFDLVPALISKRVDGIVAFWAVEAVVAESLGFPVNIIRMEKYGVPDFYAQVLVTSEEKISKDPDLVQRFVRAAMRGYQDAIANPQAAVQLMKKVKPEVDLTIESPGVDLLAPLWKSENGVFGWQEESRWFSFAKWMKENGLLSPQVDVRQAFTNRFVEKAR